MRDIVRESWLSFTEPLEGGVDCFYNDIRGLTTIAYGDLCNTPGEAAALPMVHPDGTFATSAEKVAAWHTVHDDPNAAARGWKYAATLTTLRLTRDGMATLALRKLDANDAILLRRLPDWEDYPACAQMAMHSLAWACGADFHFPKLISACQARDWDVASIQIQMNEYTPEGKRNTGLIPRNAANRLLMQNAERVQAYHLDPSIVNWTTLVAVADAETVPSLANPDSYDAIPVVNTDIIEGLPTHAASKPTLYPAPPDEPPDDVA